MYERAVVHGRRPKRNESRQRETSPLPRVVFGFGGVASESFEERAEWRGEERKRAGLSVTAILPSPLSPPRSTRLAGRQAACAFVLESPPAQDHPHTCLKEVNSEVEAVEEAHEEEEEDLEVTPVIIEVVGAVDTHRHKGNSKTSRRRRTSLISASTMTRRSPSSSTAVEKVWALLRRHG